jgi:hypothetical protein
MEVIRKIMRVVFFPFFLRKDVIIVKELLCSKMIMDIWYTYDIPDEVRKNLMNNVICISEGDFSGQFLERK